MAAREECAADSAVPQVTLTAGPPYGTRMQHPGMEICWRLLPRQGASGPLEDSLHAVEFSAPTERAPSERPLKAPAAEFVVVDSSCLCVAASAALWE
mmetsp:Transcript_61891/g.175800  ORF Transcript_61891/g.175800 Transcript_61891/m.175800 type:complete len:97 (+) Transcript_61891:699-989(+)